MNHSLCRRGVTEIRKLVQGGVLHYVVHGIPVIIHISPAWCVPRRRRQLKQKNQNPGAGTSSGGHPRTHTQTRAHTHKKKRFHDTAAKQGDLLNFFTLLAHVVDLVDLALRLHLLPRQERVVLGFLGLPLPLVGLHRWAVQRRRERVEYRQQCLILTEGRHVRGPRKPRSRPSRPGGDSYVRPFRTRWRSFGSSVRTASSRSVFCPHRIRPARAFCVCTNLWSPCPVCSSACPAVESEDRRALCFNAAHTRPEREPNQS